jgi:hypothetical protein
MQYATLGIRMASNSGLVVLPLKKKPSACAPACTASWSAIQKPPMPSTMPKPSIRKVVFNSFAIHVSLGFEDSLGSACAAIC